MTSHEIPERLRVSRADPFPEAMQGRWVEDGDASSTLLICGGEVTCFGAIVDYDYKEIIKSHDALTVTLRIANQSAEDSFQRANITGLVIDPEGAFHAYNVKFTCTFIRPERHGMR